MSDQDEASITHVEIAPLDVTFSPAARERVNQFLQSFESFQPTLGLLYGDLSPGGSGKGSWSLVAYGPETVNEMIEMYAGFGTIVCFDLDGIDVVIPQIARVAELESGVLEFAGDRLVTVPANNA